ncbi:hypothetical protein [Humibacter antri]
MSTSTTPIVKLSSTADLLALLPVLAGMPVRNSLVIAPFAGKQTSRALRIGTGPSPSPTDARTLASAALGTLSKLDDCDGVSVAVYRDESFREVGPLWYDCFGIILERLRQSGYPINDAAIVTGDGWLPYFEGDLATPRPLSEIEAQTKQIPFEAQADAALTTPETDAELAQRVGAILLDRHIDQSERDAFGRLRPATQHDPVDFLESALEDDPGTVSALTLARLIAQIDSEGAVDRTVLQIAFGRATGALSWSGTLAVREAAANAGCEPNDILMEQSERGARSPRSRRLADLLTGQTRDTPSPDRLRAGAVLLGRAIAHGPLPDRAWSMCALAWVQWALGFSSAAHETIVSTRRLAPNNSLAPIYHTVFEHMRPEWIFTTAVPNRTTRRRTSKNPR